MKKRVFGCSEADVFCFHFDWLDAVRVAVRKRAVHKERLVLWMKSRFHELDPKEMGIWLRWEEVCLLSRKVWWAVWIGSFWPKIEVFYRPEWTNVGTTWKWILINFKFRNEYYQKIRKSRWKMSHLSRFHVPILSYGPQIV